MTFNELVQEVYTITNRPDLVAETLSAVKAATVKAHMSDFYSRDLYETRVNLSEAQYLISLDIHSLIPNYRSLNYMRILDSTGAPTCFVDIITPGEVLDGYRKPKQNVAYMAGRNIELRSSIAVSSLIVGCYVMPIVSEHNFSSWIASLFPYAITKEAIRVIFKTIGYDEQSAAYNSLVAEEYSLLRATALSDQVT